MKKILLLLCLCVYAISSSGCSKPPETARDIIERSYEKHGGEALANWETMVVKGDVYMADGKIFRGEYLAFAQKPGKFRMERDLTKYERGRLFYTDIYNDGVGWTSRNLMPQYHNAYAKINKRRLDQCEGIAYFYNNADTLILQPEKKVKCVVKEDTTEIPAYVVTAIIEDDTTNLCFDKKSLYLIQEEYKVFRSILTRVSTNHKKFGKVVFPGNVSEIQHGRRGDNETKFEFKTIEYNIPVDPELFEEDKPKVK